MQMPSTTQHKTAYYLSCTNQKTTPNITITKTPIVNILNESMTGHYIYYDQNNFHSFDSLIAALAVNDYIDDVEH